MKLDPHKSWRKVEERLRTETDARRRQLLTTMIAHMQAEAAGDLDGLMATVSAHPQYHQYGVDVDAGPKSRRAVEEFYAALIDSGCHRLEMNVERLVVDQDCVLTEGVLRIAYPGSLLRELRSEVDDPDASYLYEARMAIVWSFDEQGLISGEDSYVVEDGFKNLRKLKPEELP